MRSPELKKVLLIALALLFVAFVFGQVTLAASDNGRTAAEFLLIGAGAAPAGMGGAYTAYADGSMASFWNPAGLASLEGGEVVLSHQAWYQDINLEHGAIGFVLRPGMALSLPVTYLGYGSIQGYDDVGRATDQLSVYDLAGGASFGWQLSDYLAVGVTGKYVTQKLDNVSAGTVAGDFGLKFGANNLLLAGTVANFGGKLDFDGVQEKLPTTVRLGAAYAGFSPGLMISAEYEDQLDGLKGVRSGVEYGLFDTYFIRTGYRRVLGDDNRTMSSGLSVGAGVRFDRLQFDYAFSPQDNSSSETLHRFTLRMGFGN